MKSDEPNGGSVVVLSSDKIRHELLVCLYSPPFLFHDFIIFN